MTITEMLRIALSGLKIIVAAAIGAAIVGASILAVTPPQYEATARVLVDVGLPEDTSPDGVERQIMYANYRTVTIKSLVTSDLILEPVIDELSLSTTPRQLADSVTALSALSTSIIDIFVTTDDPEKSAEIANAIAVQVENEFSRDNGRMTQNISVVQSADANIPQSGPTLAVVLGLSTLAGAFLALAFLLARHSLVATAKK
ncbi:Wzz/FepE/Etk N-terminal domain-containing protein [Rhodoglobus sp. NPDC076762]